jgi:hypothetical protein
VLYREYLLNRLQYQHHSSFSIAGVPGKSLCISIAAAMYRVSVRGLVASQSATLPSSAAAGAVRGFVRAC